MVYNNNLNIKSKGNVLYEGRILLVMTVGFSVNGINYGIMALSRLCNFG